MRQLIATLLLAGLLFGLWRVEEPARQAAATAPAAVAEKCKVEHWTYSAAGGGTLFTYLKGKTNCASGTIIVHIYDGAGKYLGNNRGDIQGYAFDMVLQLAAPKTMQIEYTIKR